MIEREKLEFGSTGCKRSGYPWRGEKGELGTDEEMIEVREREEETSRTKSA